jgi:hypothetical protein
MKALSLLLLTFLLTRSARAQFWIVSDKDGFVNVRDSANTRSRVKDTLYNGHFIFVFRFEEQVGSWMKIEYSHHGKDREGYVYHDRLIPIAHYDSIPLRKSSDNIATYSRDSVRVIVTQQKFDKTKHRLTFADAGSAQLVEIDGEQYLGTDGEVPKREYKSIEIFVGNRRISLPRAAFANLFEPTIYNTEIRYNRAEDIFYIHAENSDGAGAYDVIWRIVKGVYTDRDIELDF